MTVVGLHDTGPSFLVLGVLRLVAAYLKTIHKRHGESSEPLVHSRSCTDFLGEHGTTVEQNEWPWDTTSDQMKMETDHAGGNEFWNFVHKSRAGKLREVD